MSKKEEKTNVMRILDQKKVPYSHRHIDIAEALSGVEMAAMMDLDPARVYKTLVTVAKSREHYVFVIPVAAELDLKKAAACVGEKSIEMIPLKELLPLTGYVHGGCSPIGMKKYFTTVLDASAAELATIYFSAGRVGYQVEVAPADLAKVIRVKYGDVCV